MHDGEHLIAEVADNPEGGDGDGHAAAANFGGVNFGNNYPAGYAIAEGVAGDEAHNKNKNCHAAPVDVIKPADR